MKEGQSYTEHEKSWAAREDAARERVLDQSRWATWLIRLAPLIVRLRDDYHSSWSGASDCPVCGQQQALAVEIDAHRRVTRMQCATEGCVDLC